jgi:ferredoxin
VRDAGHRTTVTHFVHAKAAATMAGLGWIGKQTLCITPALGPRVRWCSVVTDALLPYDQPFTQDLCGDCELCVRACPHGAIIADLAGRGAGQEGRLRKCIVPRDAAEPNKAWQKWAATTAARFPRVPDLPRRLSHR